MNKDATKTVQDRSEDEDDDKKPAASTGEDKKRRSDELSSPTTRAARKPRKESVQSLTIAAASSLSGGVSLQEKWEEMYNKLKSFKEANGHCNVPNR